MVVAIFRLRFPDVQDTKAKAFDYRRAYRSAYG